MIDKEYRAEQIAKEAAKRLDEVRAGSSKSELLPCPFCGGEAEILTAESMNGGYLFGIMCNDCRSRGDVYDTEAEAVAAWNTRAELGSGTCEWNLSEKRPNAKGDDYVYGYETECGCRHTWWPDTLPSYCPSCGKKVKVIE